MNRESHQLPQVSGAGPVPVFDCRVYVSPSKDGGVSARCINLDGVEGSGPSERDALRNVVSAFKAAVVQKVNAGEEIPWVDREATRRPDEQERWIPVHL